MNRALIDTLTAALDRLHDLERQTAQASSDVEMAKAEVRRAALDERYKVGHSIPDLSYSIKLANQWCAKYDSDKWDKVLEWAAKNLPELIQRKFNIGELVKFINRGGQLPRGVLDVEAFPGLSIRRKPKAKDTCRSKIPKDERTMADWFNAEPEDAKPGSPSTPF